MIDPKQTLEQLRNKPYGTRVRILWTTVIVAAIVLIVVWVLGLKASLKEIDGKDLLSTNPTNSSSSVITTERYIQVERIESTTTGLNIYFNINNATDNILNFSQTQDISLELNNQTYHPKNVTNRQGEAFAQKILSRSMVFGILTFEPLNGVSGQITFDNLSFENTTNDSFKQKIELDFNNLEKPAEIRN